MTAIIRPDRKYTMPAHFGPCCGPRQTQEGGRFINLGATDVTRISVNYLSSEEAIEKILPEGLILDGEPVVSIDFAYLKNIAWLAGRGYNTLGVRIPVIHQGKVKHTKASFLAVIWENLADPIVVGREQLGYSKIFSDIPEIIWEGETARCSANWMGFKFADLEFQKQLQLPADKVQEILGTNSLGAGLIHHKYMPRTGACWNEADASYFTVTPLPASVLEELPADTPAPEIFIGEGSVEFHRALWEDMPTQFHIVDGLAELEVLEYRGATMMTLHDNNDLHDQYILE